MVEELKLAIKVDDDAIEQSLLKQFANAEKMANKVVLTFNNIDLDDKAIEAKFKEMQKMAGKNPIDLSIDKRSIEMLSAISKQLGSIFDIAKGKSIIDSSATVSEINKITQATKELNKAQAGSENIQSKSFTTKNKTEAYNQLKQTADVFKQFYGNEEAMHTKAGTEAAYAYYKAYEEALKKSVAQSRLESVTVDVDKDSFYNANKLSSDRIKDFESFKKYGGDITDLSAEILSLEGKLLDFADAYTKVKANLGDAPITPDIIRNIEDYVELLDKARYLESFGDDNDKDIISDHRNSAQFWLDDALFKAKIQNEEYISSLKEVKEEKEKLDVSLNKSQTSDVDSSVVEQQNKIQEELEETQKQAEQTSEALSNIADGNKSNISSGIQIEDVIHGNDKSNIDASTTAIKEESQALKQIPNSATEAANAKEKFANANKEVKASADSSTPAINKESDALKSEWDKNVKAIQDYMDAVTKLNNLNAKDKGTGKYSSQIALQEKNVEELKEKALEARTAIDSMINPHDIPLNTWRDYLDVMKKFNQASLGSAESVAKLEDALRKMDFSSLESAGTKFDSQFKNLSIKPDGDHQFLSWTNDLKELNAKIDEYNSKVKYLKENNIVDGKQVEEVKELRDEIEETINVMTKTPQSKRGWTDIGASKAAEKVANVLKQNTKMSKEARDAIRAYYNELRSGNPSQPIDEILVKVNQLVQKERELGRVGKSFGEIFKEKVIYGGAAQLAGMVGFYDVINVGREGFQTIRELDTALTEMKKVSDETTQSLKNYQATTFDVGDTVGATAKTIQESTADWMRLGESINESAESAKASNILLNVSEFESIDEATESLVAMSQAYSELDKMDIIDVLNNIGNNYSIATDGLATALQKSASALKTANNDLNSAVALATAGNAVVQDPDSVGAGIRTISLRLVGTEAAKQELESIGEETDDVITTTSKLRDTILSATAAATNDGKGFDILDSNGNYKSTYEIMQGLADLYDDIVAKDKELGTNNLNLLLETIAGKNRSNIAASILQNGEMLRSVYQDAQNSSGSAQKELDSYLDSIDGRITQLENRAQEFWYKVIDSDAIKNGITLLTDLLELGTNIVDTFGVLPTIMAGVGAGLGIKNLGKTYKYTVFKLNCFEYALYA